MLLYVPERRRIPENPYATNSMPRSAITPKNQRLIKSNKVYFQYALAIFGRCPCACCPQSYLSEVVREDTQTPDAGMKCALFVITKVGVNLAISPFRLGALVLMGVQLFVNAILSRANHD